MFIHTYLIKIKKKKRVASLIRTTHHARSNSFFSLSSLSLSLSLIADQALARRSAPAKACFNPECSEAKPERPRKGWRYPISSMDNFSDRRMNKKIKLGPVEELENGIAGPNSDEHLNPCKINPQQSTSEKEDPSTPPYRLAVPHASGDEPNGHIGLVGPHFRPAPPPTIANNFYGSTLSDTNSSGESHTRNGSPRGDARGRNQLLPRYWPRITDQELQQISGDSNSVITPLFEETLRASDAGNIGRLLVPEKCKAHFPSISRPEGLPLKVQDAKGLEWIFQFQFHSNKDNSNSKTYFLEVMPPKRSRQLQEEDIELQVGDIELQVGDRVTFSRLEPEGKLVMDFRKVSTAPPSDQEKPSQATGEKGHDGEEPWEEEDASKSEQRPEQQLEESFEKSGANFQGNTGKGGAEAEAGEEDVEEANTIE